MRDTLVHITTDSVVFPQTGLANTKIILYRDFNERYWQLIPNKNPFIEAPFIIRPITKETFDLLKEQMK